MGIGALRRSLRPQDAQAVVERPRPSGLVASYRAGLIANVPNPKAAVRRTLDQFTGFALVGLGVRMVTTSRATV